MEALWLAARRVFRRCKVRLEPGGDVFREHVAVMSVYAAVLEYIAGCSR